MTEPIIDPDELLGVVTEYYLQSGDFNGISAQDLAAAFRVPWSSLHDPLRKLILDKMVGVLFVTTDINPHIIRMGFQEEEAQILQLGTVDLHHTCIYPRPLHLSNVVDRSKHAGEPYQLCLALGEPQLAFRAFDLSVLEIYRNDPRYHYWTNEVGGRISIKSDAYEKDDFPESDKILLQTFGFAYDEDFNRGVAVYLRYLMDLTPEHQQIWKARELQGDFKLHPDYYRTSIIGDYAEGGSIFRAVLSELGLVNELARAMGRANLFNEDFTNESEPKPRNFGFLVRPTLEEFNSFVHILDKLLSENLNRAFFGNDVNFESETAREDGKIVVKPKGSIQVLDEWSARTFSSADAARWHDACDTFREIRRLRQRPAHALDENVFDQSYIKQQRDLIVAAYRSLRTLRDLLTAHPSAAQARLKIPRWIDEGKIWVM